MRKSTPTLLLAAGAAVALASCAGTPRSALAPAVRTVQPIATTSGADPAPGTPNVLTISVGVQTTAGHAVDALGQNGQKARAVIDALKGNGVADKDIQTSQLSLWPHYTSPNVLTGYDVSDTVTAKLRDVGRAGQAIDAAVAAAGDSGRLQGVSFSFDDDTGLKAQARHDAVVQARAQAQQLADAAGVKLGALRSLTETSQSTPWPVQFAGATGGAVPAAPTPIQAGTQNLTVEVTTVYDVSS
jgi:uncharacterized protein YggE